MSPFHEGKACDAVLRYIEARDGGQRSELSLPDRDGHRDPVELACRLNGKLYAVEHTGIEPFQGQIAVGEHAAAFFKPITERLARSLPPPDIFEAPALPVSPVGRLMGPLQNISVPGVPFPISLYRHERLIDAGPPIYIFHVVAGDRTEARRDRIEAGYNKKIGKLAAWKRDADARTVLIFEDNDIQLTNPGVVTEAVIDIVARAADRPDEIYLVTSCVEPWWVSPVLVGDTSLFEVGDYKWAWEIASAELACLTGR